MFCALPRTQIQYCADIYATQALTPDILLRVPYATYLAIHPLARSRMKASNARRLSARCRCRGRSLPPPNTSHVCLALQTPHSQDAQWSTHRRNSGVGIHGECSKVFPRNFHIRTTRRSSHPRYPPMLSRTPPSPPLSGNPLPPG